MLLIKLFCGSTGWNLVSKASFSPVINGKFELFFSLWSCFHTANAN